MNHDELLRDHERLIEFLYLVPVGLALVNAAGKVELLNSEAARLLMPLSSGPGLDNLFDVLAPYAPELRTILSQPEPARGTLCEGRRLDLRARGKQQGAPCIAFGLVRIEADCIMAVVQDITRTVEQERLLFAEEQRFKAICEGMRDAVICTLDLDRRIDSWNASGERLLGYANAEVAGKTLDDILMRDGDELPFDSAIRSGWGEFEGWVVRGDGRRFWGAGVLQPMVDPAGETAGFSVVLRDITEKKLANDRLSELANTDALTGLANRRTFHEQAERETARMMRYATPFSVLMIDADHFKKVNDTYGHAVGDRVLCSLAGVLRAGVRVTDLAARLGGEEFAVLLPETSAPGAKVLADRLRDAVASSEVMVEGKAVRYTVSVGVAEASKVHADVAALLAAADAALYRAKSEGRNRTVVAREDSDEAPK